MVLFLAQGASMSIEDGACLAECLGRVKTPGEIPCYLGLFEKLHKPRCEKKLLLGSQSNGKMWYLQDGPEWELRDCALSRDDFKEGASSNTGSDPGNPNPWSNKNFQPWLFGHDVFKEANEALDRMSD